MYYETQVPSLTCISLHVVLANLVDTNFALHNFFQEPKVALTKELVYLQKFDQTVENPHVSYTWYKSLASTMVARAGVSLLVGR